MLGQPCSYDEGFTCFKWGTCPYTNLLECLKTSVVANAREIEHLKHRQMMKHSEATTKWRNQSFYYKRRARALEAYLASNKIDIPSAKELGDMLVPLEPTSCKFQNPNIEKGDNNGIRSQEIHRTNKKKVGLKGHPNGRASSETGSNNDSVQGVQEPPDK